MRRFLTMLAAAALLAVASPALAQSNTNGDVTPPTISGVTVGSVTATSAVVTWTTNEAATSYVDFGPNDTYGNTLGAGTYVISHSVTLLGLTENTLYHFRVRSKDASGNEAASTDSTLTTVAAMTNQNANANTNASTNKNASTNTNANKNVNTNANKNTNLNKNTNTNANKNTNTAPDANSSANSLFNQNYNTNADTNVDVASDVTNVNATDSTATGSDGRTGLVLILLGIVLLVVVIVVAWRKTRRSGSIRV